MDAVAPSKTVPTPTVPLPRAAEPAPPPVAAPPAPQVPLPAAPPLPLLLQRDSLKPPAPPMMSTEQMTALLRAVIGSAVVG